MTRGEVESACASIEEWTKLNAQPIHAMVRALKDQDAEHRKEIERLKDDLDQVARGGVDGHAGNPKGDGAEQSPARGEQSHRPLSIRSAKQPVSIPAPSPLRR